MLVTILGSGTSAGVPMIGCTCPVCTSDNPKNRRLRASASVQVGKCVLLLDTSTDLREQAMRYNLDRVDAVLYTHAHADHIHGIDEMRVYNFRQLNAIPCYGNQDIGRRIRNYFDYIFHDELQESFRPFLDFHEVEGPFSVKGVQVVPVPLLHGSLEVLGYRIGNFAYLTDVSKIPDASLKLLEGLEVLVLDALRHRPHATHFSLDEAVEVASRLKPARTALTHISHVMEHDQVNLELPKGIELAYDGMTFELVDPA